MKRVVGIGFKEVGKIYWFNPGPLSITEGSKVVVETVRGMELGHVVCPIKEVADEELDHELKDVIRIASQKDIKASIDNEKKALESVSKVKQIVEEYKLDMKVLGCEYTLDATKLLIYYNAEGRVDFRELVKALASELKVRIELRQIGQREGAKLLGGLGTCGREVCCKGHLREFDLVTMKMAKDQEMALSSSKIAGLCGKLMCCIAFESHQYEELRKIVPGVGEFVQTPACSKCKVINADYLRKKIKTDNEGQIEEWPVEKVKRLKSVDETGTKEEPNEISNKETTSDVKPNQSTIKEEKHNKKHKNKFKNKKNKKQENKME